MADPMWVGGPSQFADRYAANWASFPQWMRDPLLPQATPLSPFAMSVTCLVLMAVPVVGTGAAVNLGEYQRYYGDWYDSTPPGSHTDEPYDVAPPAVYTPAFGADPTTSAMLTLIYGVASDAYGKANQAYEATQLILNRLPQGEDPPPIATSNDTARILAGIYYTNWLWYNNPPPVSVPDVLEAIESNHDTTDGLITAANLDIDALATNVQNAFEAQTELIGNVTGPASELAGLIGALNNLSEAAVQAIANAAVGTLTGEVGEAAQLVLDAIDDLGLLGGGNAGAPVWPGVAGVTLGQSVALTDGLHLTSAMDGVIIAITTPPSRTGTMNVGGATFDYREGQVAFEDDQGHIEMWQYLGFRNALYTPRSMQHAAGARFRVLAGAEGTVTPWTVTP